MEHKKVIFWPYSSNIFVIQWKTHQLITWRWNHTKKELLHWHHLYSFGSSKPFAFCVLIQIGKFYFWERVLPLLVEKSLADRHFQLTDCCVSQSLGLLAKWLYFNWVRQTLFRSKSFVQITQHNDTIIEICYPNIVCKPKVCPSNDSIITLSAQHYVDQMSVSQMIVL